jgi:hypothetical protein
MTESYPLRMASTVPRANPAPQLWSERLTPVATA